MIFKLIASLLIFLNPGLAFISQLNLLGSRGQARGVESLLATQSQIEPQNLPLAQEYLLTQTSPDYLPIRNWSIEEPAPDLKAGVIYDLFDDKIIWQKNSTEILSIASLTKLMTAMVALDQFNLEAIVSVSENAVNYPGQMGSLIANQTIEVKTLLYALLMESSNDAAIALAEIIGLEEFKQLMNQKAQQIGLTATFFMEPSGLHPENRSNLKDLIKLVNSSFDYPLIWDILKIRKIDLKSADGQFDHPLVNNNSLLTRLSGVIGGKTGYTQEAGGCMILVTKRPDAKGNLINIVLGSKDRLVAIEELVNWAKKAYLW